jgi:hypothetical protein
MSKLPGPSMTALRKAGKGFTEEQYVEYLKERGFTVIAPVDWMPMSKAVEEAQALGFQITPSTLTKCGERWGVKIRARTLPGHHKKEVEYRSLLFALAQRQGGSNKPDESEEPSDAERARIEEEKRKAEAAKRQRNGRSPS